MEDMKTELYHCTTFDSLKGILSSLAFYPSYCLEKAEYLRYKQEFAFAMVCFADLYPEELPLHMEKFNSSCYLKMSKDWAMRNGLAPIIYYTKMNCPLSACFGHIIDQTLEEIAEGKTDTPFVKSVNVLLSYLKQYEGQYWIDGKKDWSEKTQFYTEREWRYIPLVQNGEAYYLEPEHYKNKAFRMQKRNELIRHGYILRFAIDDVLEIGVSNQQELDNLHNYFKDQGFSSKWFEKIEIKS